MNATFLTRRCFILVIEMYMCTCIHAQQLGNFSSRILYDGVF